VSHFELEANIRLQMFT